MSAEPARRLDAAIPRVERNRSRVPWTPAVRSNRARRFHRTIPGYAPTPLVSVEGLARELGVGALLVKCEHERFGLPAFKALGAAWAVVRTLVGDASSDPTLDGARARARANGVTLLTATDGNHGHAVAWIARQLGLRSRILVPKGMAPARIDAIAAEGADVRVVNGSYDDTVRESARLADGDAGLALVSDTSWPGYEQVPRWIVEGYATIFAEIDEQLPAGRAVDAVFVPVGVGGLASAVVARYAADPVTVVSVEPGTAACLATSLRAGERIEVPGPHPSIMAGLNCGMVSMIAWPALRSRIDLAATVDDAEVVEAMRAMRALGIHAGESAAASLAGARGVLLDPDARALSGIGPDATVLLLSTEGITDPDGYARLVAADAPTPA
jgi:diaminopropionate ammonia-lyase